MTTPTPPAGWHPDPEGTPQLRWWDGKQWTSATKPQTQPESPPPSPTNVPIDPKARKRGNVIAAGVIGVVVLALIGFGVFGRDDDTTESTATDATGTSIARPATRPPTLPPTTTVAPAANCQEAPAEYLDVINSTFIDGYSFGEVKAVQRGELWYIAGQIHNAEGGIRSRDDLFVAKDLFVTPVTTTARNYSTLTDLRKVLGVDFTDPAATAALDCARTY